MSISSIDDLLAGAGNSQQPVTPEHKEKQQAEKKPVEKPEEEEAHEYGEPEDEVSDVEPSEDEAPESDEEPEEKTPIKAEPEEEEFDEYGNEKERLPKGMRDRLERKDKQHQREIQQRDQELQVLRQQLADRGASKEVQQAVKDFKHDPNDDASWEQQLSDFVKATVTNMQRDEQQKLRQHREQALHLEFQKKFVDGMGRFSDFREVVGNQPIDDAMTLALRGIKDPSAFIYAASKQKPEELKRISQIPDEYSRIVEMGRLEERMRRTKTTTKAPRTLGRTVEDTAAKPVPKQKDTTGDDLLAKADAKRLSTIKNRHRANR